MLEMGVIQRFTIDIENSKLGITEAILIVNAKHGAVSRIIEELKGLEEVKELYVTPDSDVAIISRVAGDMQRILAIQDMINLTDVNNIRIISIKSSFIRILISCSLLPASHKPVLFAIKRLQEMR